MQDPHRARWAKQRLGSLEARFEREDVMLAARHELEIETNVYDRDAINFVRLS